MASSSVPLSLLARGIGQVSKNGHERLDVYLEPEDYYNLESKYQQYQVQALRRQAAPSNASENSYNEQNVVPLHKTFLTRKGALLLFSEELAKKALEEETRKREAKVHKEHIESKTVTVPDAAEDKEDTEVLRTCNDLSWAILNYGRKPEYRKKGDELYLRFIHEPKKGSLPGRRIRPGFSPKRYISTWSKYWDEGMLQKLRTEGMISDKTLYRQNPLLPHLYQYASYNLAAVPPPYRVTKSMLLPPGNVPSYEFYRVKASHPAGSVASHGTASKAPPPSQQEAPLAEPAPIGTIQAVKYHESGGIQEVVYADLKPQEKQEILAELLIAAHEHQQHIRDTLELVISTGRPHGGDSERGGSSSGASELMADMQRAIMSLVESPVRQQMRERQRLTQEREEKLQEEKRQQQLKEERRQKRREERKAKKLAEQEQARKAAEKAALAKKAAEEVKQQERTHSSTELKAKQKPSSPVVKDAEKEIPEEDPMEEEKRLKEERRKKRREEREARRKAREEKILQQEKLEKEEEEEAARMAPAGAGDIERPPSRGAHGDERHHRRHRRRHRHHGEGDATAPAEKDAKGYPEKERSRRRRSEREAEQSVEQAVRARVVVSEQEPSQSKVYIRATDQERITKRGDGRPIEEIYTTLPQDGVSEILHDKDDTRKYHRRSMGSGSLMPLQVPVNTPAVNVRELNQPPPEHVVEYEEIIQVEKQKDRHRKRSSIDDAGALPRELSEAGQEESRLASAPRSAASSHSSGPKQILFAPELPFDDASSQKQGGSFYGGRMPITSNLVKQTLSDKVSMLSASQDSASQLEGSFHNVKSEKTSLPLKSQKSYLASEKVVPSIGIEPATPLAQQKSVTPLHQQAKLSAHTGSVPGTQYLSPSGSISGSHRSFAKRSDAGSGSDGESHSGDDSLSGSDGGKSSKKLPSKKSDSEKDDSDDNDDASQSSYSSANKSSKREVASKSSQTTSTKSKSKHASLLSDETLSTSSKSWMKKETAEPTYVGLKGQKGPGSQSSASILKSTSTKKSRSTRGSLPSAMKRGNHGVTASVRMPDGEVISVGGSLTRPGGVAPIESGPEDSDETASVVTKSSSEEKFSARISLPRPALKTVPGSKSVDSDSSVKASRRVSFQDPNVAVKAARTEESDDEDRITSHVTDADYEVTEEEESEEENWPQVKEEIAPPSEVSGDTRPISSRSEKLTAHAQKVAAMVVKKQRPKSGLDEDALKAAGLWNKALQEDSEVTSEEEEEEEEWAGAKQVESSTSESTKPSSKKAASVKSSDDEEEKRRKNRLKKVLGEKKKEKEIRPTVPTATVAKKQASIPASTSSVASSVSSVQEAFVSEMQRKASDLGIEPGDLQFQGEVVAKLEKSAITPDEVEVVHDTQAGRHVVRSRRSSTTVSSVLTPSSVEKEAKESDKAVTPKQKLVVDLKLDKSVTLSRASSVTSSATSTSPRSQPHSPHSSVTRRSSIPVDKLNVKLDYDVTTYESKLGDPKPEEPTIQPDRPRIEPEKIKHLETKPSKAEAPVKPKAGPVSKVAGGTESVKSGHSVPSKPGSKPGKGGKQHHAPTKGPQRKVGTKEDVVKTSAADRSSKTDSEKLIEEEKLHKDVAKLSEGHKATTSSLKSDGKKKKASKGKVKPAEPDASDKEITAAQRSSPDKLPNKTPETPFRAGRAKEVKPLFDEAANGTSPDEGKQESIASISKSKKGDKQKKSKKKKEETVTTQIEVDTPKVEGKMPKKKQEAAEPSKPPTPSAQSPTKQSALEIQDEEDEFEEYVPPESAEDDYEFVRREDTPEPEPEVLPTPPPKTPKPEETKSQVSEVTEATEATEISSQAAALAAEEEAERETKLAAKQERELKRAAAAEKRRQEVERKRKEKEEQVRREKEEQERQDQMREELEAERRKREEAMRMKKEEVEREKQREKEEEELRQRRLLQQQERERKQQEEYRRKMEEIQRKKKEEEEKKRELARIAAAEAEEKRKQEEEMLAQMEEHEREQYAQQKKAEEEERKRLAEEKRKREEEEAKIAMERAHMEAMIRAKQAAALEEKLRFVRELFTEANGMEQTQNVNRSFTFSYFELLQMLGLDVIIE